MGGVLKGDVLKSPGTYLYTWIASAMLVLAAILIVLWANNAISLFWVEILVALLFVAFWIVQTVELERQARLAPGDEAADLSPVQVTGDGP